MNEPRIVSDRIGCSQCFVCLQHNAEVQLLFLLTFMDMAKLCILI